MKHAFSAFFIRSYIGLNVATWRVLALHHPTFANPPTCETVVIGDEQAAGPHHPASTKKLRPFVCSVDEAATAGITFQLCCTFRRPPKPRPLDHPHSTSLKSVTMSFPGSTDEQSDDRGIPMHSEHDHEVHRGLGATDDDPQGSQDQTLRGQDASTRSSMRRGD